MRLTLAALGWTLDLSLGPDTPEEAAPEPTNQGDTGGTWVGFAVHATPEEAPFPQRTPAWDEPEDLTGRTHRGDEAGNPWQVDASKAPSTHRADLFHGRYPMSVTWEAPRWAPLWLRRMFPGVWTQAEVDRHQAEARRKHAEFQQYLDQS